jgi:hypothetical protein
VREEASLGANKEKLHGGRKKEGYKKVSKEHLYFRQQTQAACVVVFCN